MKMHGQKKKYISVVVLPNVICFAFVHRWGKFNCWLCL